MPSRTFVSVTVFLSALSIANTITCDDSTKGDNTECPSDYCFVSVTADKDQKITAKCADAVPEDKKHEVNEWIRSGGNHVYICDTPNCNRINKFDKQFLDDATKGKLVCQMNQNANNMIDKMRKETLNACYSHLYHRCVYTKDIESNETLQHCQVLTSEQLLNNENKCFKTDKEYVYYCNTTLCNNAHVCDQLELGKPSPFDQSLQAPGSDAGAGPAPDPAVSTPKNTGSAFNLPAIVLSVLVVGICFTFW